MINSRRLGSKAYHFVVETMTIEQTANSLCRMAWDIERCRHAVCGNKVKLLTFCIVRGWAVWAGQSQSCSKHGSAIRSPLPSVLRPTPVSLC